MSSDDGKNYRKAPADQRPACLAYLQAGYGNLPAAERRVAERILASPERVLVAPITRLAADCHVAASTVERLCNRLGLTGFQELKIALAVDVFNGHPAGDASARPLSTAEHAIEVAVQSLQTTRRLVDEAAIEETATALVHGRRVEVYAQGPATGAVARILQARLLLAGILSTVHEHVGFEQLSAELLAAGDVAVGLSQSGETEPVIKALAAARESGATTICITNEPLSPLAREASICLAAAGATGPPSHRPGSLVSMLALAEAVQACALAQKYRRHETGGDGHG